MRHYYPILVSFIVGTYTYIPPADISATTSLDYVDHDLHTLLLHIKPAVFFFFFCLFQG